MLCVCIFETMESKCVLSVFVCCSTLSHYKLDVKVDRSGKGAKICSPYGDQGLASKLPRPLERNRCYVATESQGGG